MRFSSQPVVGILTSVFLKYLSFCIYSKRDGIIGWQASIDKHNAVVEHIEVRATHIGVGISPDVFKVLARKLASA